VLLPLERGSEALQKGKILSDLSFEIAVFLLGS
jgi:hypothetical protein